MPQKHSHFRRVWPNIYIPSYSDSASSLVPREHPKKQPLAILSFKSSPPYMTSVADPWTRGDPRRDPFPEAQWGSTTASWQRLHLASNWRRSRPSRSRSTNHRFSRPHTTPKPSFHCSTCGSLCVRHVTRRSGRPPSAAVAPPQLAAYLLCVSQQGLCPCSQHWGAQRKMKAMTRRGGPDLALSRVCRVERLRGRPTAQGSGADGKRRGWAWGVTEG